MALYGLNRKMFKNVYAQRLVLDGELDTTPAYAPLFINPSGAPTTGTKGGMYFDSTTNRLVGYNGTSWVPSGSQQTVYTTPVTLTAADSGALCVFSTAAGQLYTLPAAAVGLTFEFAVDVTATSGVHRVACATGDFLFGSILQGADVTFSQVVRTANGSTHLAWEGNGTTKGGIIGDNFRVTALDGTKWQIRGVNTATGTEATPFVTS